MNRLISLIVSLSLLCTCFVCNISVGASEDVPTDYGTIPSEYADSTQYPVVVFKKDGTFLKASSIFADNTSACAMYYIRGDYSGNKGKYLLVRNDVTMGSYPNIHYHYNEANVIDLGGNTLTITSDYMLSVVQRFTKNVNLTIKNGTIVYPGKILGYGDNKSYTGSAKFNFSFENITFRLSEDSVSTNIIASGSADSDPIESNINFDNCIFDLSARDASTNATLFGTDFSGVTSNITVKGGRIIASDCETLSLVSVNDDSSSVVFVPDEDGEYTMLTLSSSASGCMDTIPADSGDAYYVLVDDDGELSTYMLKSDFISLPDVIVNRVNFENADGTECVNAVVRNITDSDKTVIMVVAGYDDSGAICFVKTVENLISGVSPFEAELDGDAVDYEVFFLDGWDSLLPIDGIIYTADGNRIPAGSVEKEATSSSYINASYDVSSEAIEINAEGYGDLGDVLCVNVVSSDEEMSQSNPPVISAMYGWTENGTISISIPVCENIASGKYNIVVSGNGIETLHITGVLIFRKDSVETKEALEFINSAESYSEFNERVTEKSFSLGIDYLFETDWNTITKVMYGVKCSDGDFTVDSFSAASDYGRAVVLIRGGETIDSVMQMYSSVFNTTFEEYSSLSDSVKEELNQLILESDFYDGYINYEELGNVAKVSGCSSFEELKDVISSNPENYDVDLDGDYKKLSSNDKGKVFKKMYSERDDFTSISDISESFEDAVKYYLKAKDDSGSGGSSSGKKPSGGVSFGGPTGTTNVTLPSPSADEKEADGDDVSDKITNNVYTDIDNHFAYDDILYLSGHGIINGYSDGTYKPNGNVTRAELCKIIALAFNITSSGDISFEDVSAQSWYFDYVSALAENGIVVGDGKNFRPDDMVTRQDAAVIIYRTLLLKGMASKGSYSFADRAEISDYAKEAVESVASLGIMVGDESGFRPSDMLKRGEFAAVISRTVKGV